MPSVVVSSPLSQTVHELEARGLAADILLLPPLWHHHPEGRSQTVGLGVGWFLLLSFSECQMKHKIFDMHLQWNNSAASFVFFPPAAVVHRKGGVLRDD
jgi:hypothetical protein